MAKEKISLKFSGHQMLVFLALAGVAVAGVMGYQYYLKNLAPVHFAEFEGENMAFRADLREAAKVPVTPDEGTLRSEIVRSKSTVENGTVVFRQPTKNVTIVFKSTIGNGTGPNTMGWYTVEVSEIIRKLTAMYRLEYGIDVSFAVREVQSYDGLRSGNLAPIIALVHPDLAEGTYVSVDEEANVITISGGDSLADFDRATVRFLMAAMEIKV